MRFADLDLSKFDGAARLYSRLSQAAAIVCRPPESRNLLMATQYRVCVDDAIAGAVAGVGRPILSQYRESHTKGDKIALAQFAKG